MDRAIQQLIDQMRKDTQENIRRIMREAAQQARKDFTKEAKNCIDNYYAEYDPTSYYRTNTLRNHSYSPYTLWSLRRVQSGVHFIDDDMSYRHLGKNFTTEDVIDSLMFGVHGVDLLDPHEPKNPERYGDPIGEKMEKFEEMYESKMDAYFRSQGLKRIG